MKSFGVICIQCSRLRQFCDQSRLSRLLCELCCRISDNVLANDQDVDGDSLTANLVSSPLHGTVSLNQNGDFTYTPNENYFGTDLFSYSVSDGNDGAAENYVLISVAAVNDPPTAFDDIFEAEINELTGKYDLSIPIGEILANDTDIEGDSLQVTDVSGPESGVLTLDPSGTFFGSSD